MTVKVRIVHGNSDVDEQEFDDLEEAIEAARQQEKNRHGEDFEIEAMHFKYQSKDWIQFGTDYHYIEIARQG